MSLTHDYLQKLNIAREILVENYLALAESKEFLLLIDKDNVYSVTINEFNKIINRDCFSDTERAYIREQRKKAVNRQAAKVSRRRRKEEEQSLDFSVKRLQTIKYELMMAKKRLEGEVAYYKFQCHQEIYQPVPQWAETQQTIFFQPHQIPYN